MNVFHNHFNKIFITFLCGTQGRTCKYSPLKMLHVLVSKKIITFLKKITKEKILNNVNDYDGALRYIKKHKKKQYSSTYLKWLLVKEIYNDYDNIMKQKSYNYQKRHDCSIFYGYYNKMWSDLSIKDIWETYSYTLNPFFSKRFDAYFNGKKDKFLKGECGIILCRKCNTGYYQDNIKINDPVCCRYCHKDNKLIYDTDVPNYHIDPRLCIEDDDWEMECSDWSDIEYQSSCDSDTDNFDTSD